MKKNYFNLGERGLRNLFLSGVACAVSTIGTAADKEPPAKKSFNFFDVEDYVQLSVSGFNEDVIANGVGASDETTTNSVDNSNYCFFELGTQFSEGGAATTSGLPTDGILTNPNDGEITFQLEDYSNNNVLRLRELNAYETLTFEEENSYAALYLAVTGGDAGSDGIIVDVTVNFEDGTSQEVTGLNVLDWYNGTSLPVLIQGLGRKSINSGTDSDSYEASTANPRIYQLTVNVAPENQLKTVTGITVTKTVANGTFNMFAATGKLAGDCLTPGALVEESVTPFDATFSWEAFDGADTFELAVVATGAAMPSEGTVVEATTYTFEDLDAETTYDVYHRTVCETDESYWVGPYTFTTPIACEVPTAITVEDITTETANVSWTAGEEGQTSFEVAVVESGGAFPESGEEVTGTSYDVSGLISATQYNVYVRANCGDTYGYSDWASAGFVSGCDAYTAIDESFEADSLPFCWGNIDTNDSGYTWNVFSYSNNAHTGIYSMRLGAPGYSQEASLILPQLAVEEQVNDVLSFWIMSTQVEDYEVLVSTTSDAEEDFTEVLTSGFSNSAYTQIEVNLTAYAGQDIYVAINAESSGSFSYVYVDDVLTSASPDCLVPENLTASGVTTDAFTVSWDEGDAANWEIAYVASGEDAPESGEAVTETSYDFSDLTTNTSYDVYLRANCGDEDGFSEWISITVTTHCDAVTMIDESFEEGASVPDCWSVENASGSASWVAFNSATYSNTGSYSARLYATSGTHESYLIAPHIAIEEHTNDIFSFYARRGDTYYDATVDVLVSTTGNAPEDFTDVLASDILLPGSQTYQEFDLSAYDGQTIFVAIVGNLSQSYASLYIDDVLTSGSEYCAAPTELAVEDLTVTTATLTWDAADATSWEIAIQEEGTGEPTTAGTVVEEATYNDVFTAGTTRELYVRALCADGVNYSPWAGPFAYGGYASLSVSGFNYDVIANGVGDASASTNNDIDGGGYAYLSQDFKVSEEDEDLTYGLPVDGVISSSYEPGLSYAMADYSENNSLRIATVGAENGGTLTFTDAQPAEKVYLLVVSGSGAGSITGTIHFEDETTQTISATSVPDWYYSTELPVAVSGIGRVNTANNSLENPSGDPRIYELELIIGQIHQNSAITSIDFVKESGGVVHVFAASIKYSSYAASVDNVTANTAAISVYPNPVNNNLHISGVDATAVEVYNMLGQQVSVKLSNNTVDMSALNTGIYLVTVHSQNATETIRVIKK